jgi:transglutaminase-like putative cysteine protease
VRPFGVLYGSYYIPPGDAGTLATLDAMRAVAGASAQSWQVRDVAAQLVQGEPRDPMEHANLVGNWVIQHTEFLPDPSNAEALLVPEDALQLIAEHGVVQCDCDDVAMLTAALGMSIGLRARFVAVAFDSSGAPFAHVWCDLGDPSGQHWLTVDPEAHRLTMPAVTRTETVEV